jgi:CRISPR-associated protein Cmr1
MEITLKTLTPLWTGGVDGICDRVHETGIIGSLRWWYEALVRGLGERACDPTARTGRCQDDRHCVACDLFGCTGWARRFRLQLDTGRLAYPQRHKRDLLKFKPPGRNTGWYYGAGQLAIDDAGIGGQLIVLRDEDYGVANEVLATMQLAATWGGIGARTQHGYGVVRVQAARDGEPVRVDPATFLAHHPVGSLYHGPHPALTDFFFARFQLVADAPDQWWTRTDRHNYPRLGAPAATLQKWAGGEFGPVSIAPAVKSQLRYGSNAVATRWGNERYIFGHIKPQRRKAKINISAVYQDEGRWTFRIWGWLPRDRANFKRAAFLNDLHTVLRNQNFWLAVFGHPLLVDLTSVVWREFDSPRTTRRITDAGVFLTSLLV